MEKNVEQRNLLGGEEQEANEAEGSSVRLTKAGGKRRGAGAPPKKACDKKTERFTVGLTPGEYRRFNASRNPGEKKDSDLGRRLVLMALSLLESQNEAKE